MNSKNDSILFLSLLIVAIIIASSIDFLFGWVNAKFNADVVFKSGVALHGIIKKMMYIIVLVFFLYIAFLIAPKEIAVSSLTILYLGFLYSEINSIFSHLGLTEDGKDGALFIDFLKKVFKGVK